MIFLALISVGVIGYRLWTRETEPYDPGWDEITSEEVVHFRSIGVNVKNWQYDNLWWRTFYWGSIKEEGKTIIREIRERARNPDDPLNKTYGSSFVNSYNNTVWIVLTDTSPETLDEINLNISRTKIKILKGPSTRRELLDYNELVLGKAPSLRKKGLSISTVYMSVNGTLVVGIEVVSKEGVELLLQELPEIPLETLYIEQIGPVEPA